MNELQWAKRNAFFIKSLSLSLSLSHFILDGGTQFIVREMERHILREGTSSCPISSSWSQGVPTLASPCEQYCQRRLTLLIGCVSLARLSILTGLSVKISPRDFHITWSPSGYTPLRPAYPDALSSPCLLITTWQLVKAHGVISNEPKIHVNSQYITISRRILGWIFFQLNFLFLEVSW